MDKKQRSRLAAGLMLILVGAWFMLLQIRPDLAQQFSVWFQWPTYVIGAGLLLLILGLLAGAPGMAVPACITAGVGALLYYQNANNDWASWRYAWTLILGFIGVGVMLDGLLSGRARQGLKDGVGLIVISALLLLVFSSLTGGPFSLGVYWPVLIILWGLWVIVRTLFRWRK